MRFSQIYKNCLFFFTFRKGVSHDTFVVLIIKNYIMKNLILLASLTFSLMIFAQDSLIIDEKNETRIFTVNPAKNVKNTAGINVGILDDYKKQKINGFNFQLNPFSALYFLIPKAIPIPTEEKATVVANGLHISTGGMVDGNQLNGVGISAYHHAMESNGFTVNFFNNTSGKLNGLHVSGMANNSEKGNGITISILGNYSNKYNGVQISGENFSESLNGVQIGLVNKTTNSKGLQIGLVNKSKKHKGVQIGFWNKNGKRTLPILNF